MHRVKFNDYAELLSDDLNNNNAYLYNGLVTTIADFIAANDCVSGLEVTAQAVPDMTVYVKAGRIYQDGYQGFLEADLTTPLTIAPASASQPRIDLICAKYEEVEDEPEIRNVLTDVVSRNVTQIEVKTRIASAIAFQVVGGTAAAEPTVPTTPEGWVALAKVTVPANTSVIQQSNIVDMRPKIINIYQHDHSGGANGTKIDYNDLNNLPDLSAFKGASSTAAGEKGMVPAPAQGKQNALLAGDGTFHDIATTEQAKAGTDDIHPMTPAKTKAAIEALVEGIPVGDVVYRPFLMSGYVKANGATVNRADYPNLVQYANDHSLWTSNPSSEPWKYGTGNGSTTMVLPDYRNRVIQGGDSTAILSPSLPNITGEATGYYAHDSGISASGALSESANYRATNPLTDQSNTLESGNVKLDASKSNAIYGASDTVQPPAIVLIPQIRY